ncbi:hypothetical protein BJ508DRAFT_153237 [Ascobolus immersus RN42]|uniref:Uncharacterized protein n=1 Tax=Ascobolus immersus RN42 TaxID=1160509 RepID=A0A3N4HYC4_ASCIM|nr:hypothetical protein BJ508DRAFT_153237 [Ascobolus immersus RN42]
MNLFTHTNHSPPAQKCMRRSTIKARRSPQTTPLSPFIELEPYSAQKHPLQRSSGGKASISEKRTSPFHSSRHPHYRVRLPALQLVNMDIADSSIGMLESGKPDDAKASHAELKDASRPKCAPTPTSNDFKLEYVTGMPENTRLDDSEYADNNASKSSPEAATGDDWDTRTNENFAKEVQSWQYLGPNAHAYFKHYQFKFRYPYPYTRLVSDVLRDDDNQPLLESIWRAFMELFPAEGRKLPASFYEACDAYLNILFEYILPTAKEYVSAWDPVVHTIAADFKLIGSFYLLSFGFLRDIKELAHYLNQRLKAGLLRGSQVEFVTGVLRWITNDFATILPHLPLGDVDLRDSTSVSWLELVTRTFIRLLSSSHGVIEKLLKIRVEKIEVTVLKYWGQKEICWDVVNGITIETALGRFWSLGVRYYERGRCVYDIPLSAIGAD